ncbi:MAG TPA: glutathione synthase [Woeseiaceae bacterium]|nr:glutathione synthase [Woeseiaceae bacterium]
MPENKLSVGVVMDPIRNITTKKDSSFAMLLEAQRRGAAIHYMELGDLSISQGVAKARSRLLTVRDQPADWFDLHTVQEIRLGDLDVILMRKDPPFDMEYIYATYILERAGIAGALVVNRPQSLRDMNEKAYTAWFPECCPETLITRSMPDMKSFLRSHGRIVVKPLHGMGGRSIFVISSGDNNANVIFETLTDYGQRFAMAQVYIPEILQGDKRILLVDGEPIPYALARIPSADDNRGNLVMGATGEGRELSERDRWICSQVGPALKERGVLFAGLDVIGDYLTEINITSPTGIRELDRQFGLNIAGGLFDAIDRHPGRGLKRNS